MSSRTGGIASPSKRKRGRNSSAPQISGIIPDRGYSLEEFMALTGFKRPAIRAARQAGLPVRYVHGRGIILGRDFLAYVERCGKSTLR